jgi:hypothetical protein
LSSVGKFICGVSRRMLITSSECSGHAPVQLVQPPYYTFPLRLTGDRRSIVVGPSRFRGRESDVDGRSYQTPRIPRKNGRPRNPSRTLYPTMVYPTSRGMFLSSHCHVKSSSQKFASRMRMQVFVAVILDDGRRRLSL